MNGDGRMEMDTHTHTYGEENSIKMKITRIHIKRTHKRVEEVRWMKKKINISIAIMHVCV